MVLDSLTTLIQNIPTWVLVIITAWELAWKGFALWKSARLSQPIWFIVLLIVNTLGILPILYIFIFSNIKGNKSKVKRKLKR